MQPRALRGEASAKDGRGRGGGHYKMFTSRKFVVAASAAANSCASGYPAPSAGLDCRARLRARRTAPGRDLSRRFSARIEFGVRRQSGQCERAAGSKARSYESTERFHAEGSVSVREPVGLALSANGVTV